MNWTLEQILFQLSVVIEKIDEKMISEKDMERGKQFNEALYHAEQLKIILEGME